MNKENYPKSFEIYPQVTILEVVDWNLLFGEQIKNKVGIVTAAGFVDIKMKVVKVLFDPNSVQNLTMVL